MRFGLLTSLVTTFALYKMPKKYNKRASKPLIKVPEKKRRVEEDELEEDEGETLPPQSQDPDHWMLDDDEDDVSEVADNTRSARNKPLILSDEVEHALVEWIQQNETLYDKTKEGYRKTGDKNRLWQSKADELNITLKALLVWYKSQKTMFAKLLLSTKSGEGDTMTDREKWILEKWSFLKMFPPHGGRVPSSVSTYLPYK